MVASRGNESAGWNLERTNNSQLGISNECKGSGGSPIV